LLRLCDALFRVRALGVGFFCRLSLAGLRSRGQRVFIIKGERLVISEEVTNIFKILLSLGVCVGLEKTGASWGHISSLGADDEFFGFTLQV